MGKIFADNYFVIAILSNPIVMHTWKRPRTFASRTLVSSMMSETMRRRNVAALPTYA